MVAAFPGRLLQADRASLLSQLPPPPLVMASNLLPSIKNPFTRPETPIAASSPRSSLVLLSLCALLAAVFTWPHLPAPPHPSPFSIAQFEAAFARCEALHETPGPPADFYDRSESDRFDAGTPDVWIRNATVWTGDAEGTDVVAGDVWLSRGIVQHVAGRGRELPTTLSPDAVEIDAGGAFLTPGGGSCLQTERMFC